MAEVLVLITAKDHAEAEKIADRLLDHKLAACVSIAGEVLSRFLWEGRRDEALERLVIVKTTAAVYPDLEKAVKEVHSYDVPEILALPVAAGNKDYLQWVAQTVKGEGCEK